MPSIKVSPLDQVVLDIYPAMEVRFESKLANDKIEFWTRKWIAAGGMEFDCRLIALKNDPVWRAMTGQKKLKGEAKRTGIFRGAGVRRTEVEALGLIEKMEELEPAAFDEEYPKKLTRTIDLAVRYPGLKRTDT